jgi:hypothetical protein
MPQTLKLLIGRVYGAVDTLAMARDEDVNDTMAVPK